MFSLFFSRRLKFIGFLCILCAFVFFYTKHLNTGLYDFNLLCGLLSWGFCFVFFGKERLDDERIHMLKFRALTYGVPLGLLVTHLVNYFCLNMGKSNSDLVLSISAFQSIAIMLGISLIVFYGLKFKEERE